MSPSENNLIGIDYGTRKTGLAYSVGSFAFGWKTVPTKDLIKELQSLIQTKKSDAIVIGMPYNIDGSMSQHGKRVLQYVKQLKTFTPLPIYTHDERLTSSAASMSFIEDGIDGDIDTEAARLILE
jgi:putative Holliday junction resolvase